MMRNEEEDGICVPSSLFFQIMALLASVLRDFAKQGLPVMECFQTRLPAQALRYLFLRQVNSTSRG